MKINIFSDIVSMILLFKKTKNISRKVIRFATNEGIKNSYDAEATIIRVRLKYSDSLGIILSIADN